MLKGSIIEFQLKGTLSDTFFSWQQVFIEDQVLNKKDDKTIQNYNSVLDNFIDFCQTKDSTPIEKIDNRFMKYFMLYRDEQALKKYNKNELSYWTKKNDIKVIKLFFDFIEDYSYENDDIDTIEFRKIRWKKLIIKKERKEKPYYHKETIVKYLNYLDKQVQNKRETFYYGLSLAFKLCLYGGLRASEVCNITFKDFDKVRSINSKKLIDLNIKGKGNTFYKNPLPYDYIKKEYSHFKRRYEKGNINKLFFSKTGASLTRFTLYRYFEKITQELGIEKKGIHILRHTFANNLNNLEIDLADIQELMRHADPSTTRVYTQRSSKRLDSAVSVL